MDFDWLLFGDTAPDLQMCVFIMNSIQEFKLFSNH